MAGVISQELLNKVVLEFLSSHNKDYNEQTFSEDEWYKVTDLILCMEGICRIENLEPFICLQNLNLSHNEIVEIRNLDELKKLEVLDLSYNRISSTNGLQNLHRLRVLHLERNRISEVVHLSNLPALRLLNLKHNQIDDIKSILRLNHARNLQTLWLQGNDVLLAKRAEILKQLPRLKFLDQDDLIERSSSSDTTNTEIVGDRDSATLLARFYDKADDILKKWHIHEILQIIDGLECIWSDATLRKRRYFKLPRWKPSNEKLEILVKLILKLNDESESTMSRWKVELTTVRKQAFDLYRQTIAGFLRRFQQHNEDVIMKHVRDDPIDPGLLINQLHDTLLQIQADTVEKLKARILENYNMSDVDISFIAMEVDEVEDQCFKLVVKMFADVENEPVVKDMPEAWYRLKGCLDDIRNQLQRHIDQQRRECDSLLTEITLEDYQQIQNVIRNSRRFVTADKNTVPIIPPSQPSFDLYE